MLSNLLVIKLRGPQISQSGHIQLLWKHSIYLLFIFDPNANGKFSDSHMPWRMDYYCTVTNFEDFSANHSLSHSLSRLLLSASTTLVHWLVIFRTNHESQCWWNEYSGSELFFQYNMCLSDVFVTICQDERKDPPVNNWKNYEKTLEGFNLNTFIIWHLQWFNSIHILKIKIIMMMMTTMMATTTTTTMMMTMIVYCYCLVSITMNRLIVLNWAQNKIV